MLAAAGRAVEDVKGWKLLAGARGQGGKGARGQGGVSEKLLRRDDRVSTWTGEERG